MAYNYNQSIQNSFSIIPNSYNSTNSYNYFNNNYSMAQNSRSCFENNIIQLARIQQNDQNSYFNNQYVEGFNYRPLTQMKVKNKALKPQTSSTCGSFNVNKRQSICGFCKRNGESIVVYSNHLTKDLDSGKVLCPILMRHVCELCGATGEEAHTRSHCPIAETARTDPFIKGMVEKSTAHKYHNMVSLKRTRINSAGKLRSSKSYPK